MHEFTSNAPKYVQAYNKISQ